MGALCTGGDSAADAAARAEAGGGREITGVELVDEGARDETEGLPDDFAGVE